MRVEQGPLLRLLPRGIRERGGNWRNGSRWKMSALKMGTFLFQQFPCLAFTSQWPIQQQVMPWHIQMGPILKGRTDTGLDNETQHEDKPWQTSGPSEGGTLALDVEHALVHRGDPGVPLTPVIKGCRVCCLSCLVSYENWTNQIRRANLKKILLISVWVESFSFFFFEFCWEEADPVTQRADESHNLTTRMEERDLGLWEMRLWMILEWMYPPFLFAAFTKGEKKEGKEGLLLFIWNFFFFISELNPVHPEIQTKPQKCILTHTGEFRE